MENLDKRKENRHRSAGYAATGYSQRKESDGDVYLRFGTANLIVCRRIGTRKHKKQTGARDCRSKGKGC